MAHSSQLRDIFAAAAETQEGPQREQFLNGACGNNICLRKEIVSLLKFHDDAGSFFREGTDDTGSAVADTDLVGTSIGPYQLRDELGTGGFGVVYVAEQTEPVRRKVALKVIKPGMDTKEVIARFEAERQALALMDHSNISKVLDAGTTERGRPFFVMELVDGRPITRFCDEHELDVQKRLELFRDVCHAVQHAHQKGIIHRDIKPSNVLVTITEGKPTVKVIDFGVAKALGQPLTNRTLYTHFSQLIGTPLYMSPEQAEGTSDIDTRTDVYSLGVLLYELLTGTTPYSREQLGKAGVDDIRRIIREDEPTRPSTKISTLGEALPGVAAVRRQQPRQLASVMKGDLDWIVMKSMEKDRNRRYATALEFAEDIDAYLNHQPVEATPPSAAYRFRKFARRNKGLLTAGAMVTISLIAGIIGTTWKAIDADRERNRATSAEKLAESRLRDALSQQRETQKALAKATLAEEAQRRLRVQAETRERYARQLVYTSDVRMAAAAQREGDTRTMHDLLQRQVPTGQEPDLRGIEWTFLKAMIHAEHRDLDVEGDGGCFVRFLPSIDHFVTAHYSGRVHLFDAASERRQKSLNAPSSFTNGVDVSPDGTTLASIGDDGFIRLWDRSSGMEIAKVKAETGQGHRVYFVNDGQSLISSGEEPCLRFWDTQSLSETHVISGFAATPHHGVKNRLAVSSDRRRCVAADQVDVARIYDIATREVVASLDLGSGGYVTCLDFSPDQNLIAGGRQGCEVTIWNADTGQVVQQFSGHLDDVQDVSFHPDSQHLASSDKSGVVRLWAVSREHVAESVGSVTAGWPTAFVAHEDRIWSLDFSPDGKKLITACRDGSVRIWPARDQPRQIMDAAKLEPQTCWLNDQEIVLSADDHLVFGNPCVESKVESEPFRHGIQSLAVSVDRKMLATGHLNGEIRVWDVPTRQVIHHWQAHDSTIHELSFSQDATRIASCGEDGRANVWELNSHERIVSHEFPSLCRSIAMDPSGQTIAIAVQNEVYMGEAGRQSSLMQLEGHLNSVDCLCFTNDGSKILTGSDDRTVRIWNVADGALQHVIYAHKNKIESLTLSPDGETIVSGDKAGRIAFSHLATGRFLYDVNVLEHWAPEDIATPDHWVSDLDVSPDGKRLVAGIFRVGYIVLGD